MVAMVARLVMVAEAAVGNDYSVGGGNSRRRRQSVVATINSCWWSAVTGGDSWQ